MRGKPVALEDFGGGVDLANDPRELPGNLASDMRNMVPGSNGRSVKSRPARNSWLTVTSADASPADQATSLFWSPLIGLTGGYVYSDGNGWLYSVNGTTITRRTNNTLYAGVATGSNYAWSSAVGRAGGVNLQFFVTPGTGTEVLWDGSSALMVPWATTGGRPTPIKTILWRANRMWAIVSDVLYWSDLGDADSFPAANQVRLAPGESLVTMCDCGPYIAVFGRRRFWVITDFDIGANRLVSDQHAIASEGGNYFSGMCATHPDGCFFGTDENIYFTDGNRIDRIGDAIAPLYRSLITIITAKDFSSMAFDGRYLHVAAGVPASSALHFVYDTALKSWWIENFSSTAMTHAPGANYIDFAMDFVGVGRPSRLVKWGPEYTGGSETQFLSYWTRSGLDFGSGLRKRVRALQLVGDAPIDQVTVTRDGASDARTPVFVNSEARVPTLGVGREWGVTVAGTDTAQWELNKLLWWLQERSN